MGESEITLPKAGLAEDILGQYVAQTQAEVNKASAAPEKSDKEVHCHLVTFRMGKEEYGVPIGNVQEIIRAVDITQVPGAPDHVRGVINLRGRIIPVVDLRKRFSLPDIGLTDKNRIIVLELGEKRIGMLVDSVSQVVKFSSEVVEEIPPDVVAVDECYIKGIAKLGTRLIIILHLNRALLLSEGY